MTAAEKKVAAKAKYEAAKLMLLDGAGTRQERIAALGVVQDYIWNQALS